MCCFTDVDTRVRGPDLRGQHTQKNLWHAQKLAWTANWPHSEQWPSGVIGREQTGLLSIFRSALNLAWRICGFFWLPRYFSKARTSVAPNVDRGVAARLPIHTGAPPSVITSTSDSIQTSSSSPPAEKKNNGLTFALTTLSSVIRNIPGVALLNSFIDPLLDITGRIEQTSANEEQLNALANRIARLAPIISGIAEKNPQQGESFVQALQSELQSITKDLEAARSRGKLDQFFDGTDGAAAIHKHQANLSRLITDYTLVAVISNSGQELERSKLQESK
ncbi:hypothetical protein MVEN_00783100 [Mycena venus]|uniref:Uncharacterized protein n=1 Tax=Mycena venus TaxID=2733690 RepID=A0A8H7D6E9_9AGAR|nr:hypothetical protein MVEN_00783100 [Mycena venus]